MNERILHWFAIIQPILPILKLGVVSDEVNSLSVVLTAHCELEAGFEEVPVAWCGFIELRHVAG